jgi:hypothetical protein
VRGGQFREVPTKVEEVESIGREAIKNLSGRENISSAKQDRYGKQSRGQAERSKQAGFMRDQATRSLLLGSS